MDKAKRILAGGLSAALLLLSPGFGPYSALAQTVTGRVSAVPTGAGMTGAVGVVSTVKVSGGLQLTPGIGGSLATIVPGASPVVRTAVIPGKTAAAFTGVRYDAGAVRAEYKKGSSQKGGMPVEKPAKDDGPDSTNGTDDLGNPSRRDNDDGPDSVSDGSDNDRSGNDGLFKSFLKDSKAFAALKAVFSKSSKNGKSMPVEEPAGDDGPDGTDGLDDLGNPRRGTDRGGPDDVWDGSDNDRSGNDGLFATLDFAKSSSKNDKSMPVEKPGRDDGYDGSRNIDDLGNPSRRDNNDNPDSVWDGSDNDRSGNDGLFTPVLKGVRLLFGRPVDPVPPGNNRGGGGGGGAPRVRLFGYAAPILLGGAAAIASAAAALTPMTMVAVYLGLVVPSLVLHEMGHALAADILGDSSARQAGRLGFGFRDLLTHIDPLFTVVIPVAGILLSMNFLGVPLLIGGARPVQVQSGRFADPVRDMGVVAAAGPLVNFLLAAGFGGAYALLSAVGAVAVLPALALGVWFNVMLGVFNMLPTTFFGAAMLDGGHVARALAKKAFGETFALRVFGGPDGSMSATTRVLHAVGFIAALSAFGNGLYALINGLAGGLLPGGSPSFIEASSLLPGLAALGALLGRIVSHGSDDDVLPPAEPGAEMPVPVDLIVRFEGAPRALTQDLHMSFVRGSAFGARGYTQAYRTAQAAIVGDLENVGLDAMTLASYGATPIATYRRINAATLRVPADSSAALRAELERRGFKVYDNAVRRIYPPVEEPNRPEEGSPAARGAVTIPETLKLSTMDQVHALARASWGAPAIEMGFFGKLAMSILSRFGLADLPQPRIAVIDTGTDTRHKMLKGVRNINATGGQGTEGWSPEASEENNDDNGHGTWVTSMVRAFAPWTTNITHYKAFRGGSATTDDILKALTVAGNDGALVISNSWGDDEGDPEGPDTLLVRKLAEEGHVMVFAAGNAGSGKNTVGAPAITYYRDPKTGAPRVLAVAATGRDGKVVYFSSRGKGSPVTSRDPKYKDWPQRPDLAEEGSNTEGAWPTNQRPGRVDPVFGPVSAISGTSMSTPKIAGTIAMLAQFFGVTEVGEKLDLIVNAVMSTLVNPLGQKPDDIGLGFNSVFAAYTEIAKTLEPVTPKLIARLLLGMTTLSAARQARLDAAAAVPAEVLDEYRRIRGEIGGAGAHLALVQELGMPPTGADAVLAGYLLSGAARAAQLERQHPGLRYRTSLGGRVRLKLRGLI
ncbi:MAG: S8 family serine peptidase [Elusimicrobiota bacterium]|jgi:Zn-dependent protease